MRTSRNSSLPGPYVLADRRRRQWLRAGGWALVLAAIVMIAAQARDRRLPHLVDLAVSLGMGAEVAGADVSSWHCGPYQPHGFWEGSQRRIRHECLVRVRGTVGVAPDGADLPDGVEEAIRAPLGASERRWPPASQI